MQKSTVLSDTKAELDKLNTGQLSVDGALVNVYECITQTDVRPRMTPGVFSALGEVKVSYVNPVVPLSVVLMIDDILLAVFDRIAENDKLKRKIEGLLESDEQLAVAALIDLLTPYLGLPPLCVVTALVVKVGYKGLLRIGPAGPQYQKDVVRKLFGRCLPDGGADQVEVDLFAAILHRDAGNHQLCKRRLARCEGHQPRHLNTMGYIYVEIGEVERGRRLVMEALKGNPSDPATLDSLAWAEYKRGELGEALRNIQKGLRHVSKHGGDTHMELLYHGVLVAQSAGDKKLRDEYLGELASLDKKRKWLGKLE